MRLRAALLFASFAFVLGAFVGYEYAGGRVAEAPVAVVPASAPLASSTPGAAPAPRPDRVVAPPTSSASSAVVAASAAILPAPTVGDQLRSRPSGPDPTQMGQAEFKAEILTFFEHEKEDPAWKASTEAFLTDHFYREDPLGPGATLTSLECRTTICRFTATSHERRPDEVLGPRSARWGELVTLHVTANTPPGDAPMQITGYLRPMSTFPPPP